MELDTVLPTLELGPDPEPLHEYAQGVEAAGYGHLLASDHVLGVDPERDWDGPYDNDDLFHEPLTTPSHLAAVTDDLSFGTASLILPRARPRWPPSRPHRSTASPEGGSGWVWPSAGTLWRTSRWARSSTTGAPG